jgi:Ca2+/Na+ antiporter
VPIGIPCDASNYGTVPKESQSGSVDQLESISDKTDGGNMLQYLEMMCWPCLKFLELTLPMELLPELSFVAIILIFFVSIDFILTVVSVLSIYTHFTHILIALTIIAWGSSPIELINLVIANRKNELQIGLTSILSGIVLAFYVMLPLAIIFKMWRRDTYEI